MRHNHELGVTRTVTSKLQLTLPAYLTRKLGIVRGHKLRIRAEHGRIILMPSRATKGARSE